MDDVKLRKALIRLAHQRPELRPHLLPLLAKSAGCEKLPEGPMRDNCESKKEEGADKTAGCEKLPEGPMRDNCEKKKEEGGKEAASKVAVKPDTEDFIQWVMNTQDAKSPIEVEKFINNVLHIDTKPLPPPSEGPRGPRFQKGDQVEIRADKHTVPATKAVYDQFDGKTGTVTEVDGQDVLVEFKAGAAPVRFPGAQSPRGVGIYAYTPAYTIEGSPMFEMVYLRDPTAKPSNDAKAEVAVYLGGGRGTETRSANYYTGSCAKAAMGQKGFYFMSFPQQRVRVDPASESTFRPRAFNPKTGAVLYIGLIGKRPGDWKRQLEQIQQKIEGQTVTASATKKA